MIWFMANNDFDIKPFIENARAAFPSYRYGSGDVLQIWKEGSGWTKFYDIKDPAAADEALRFCAKQGVALWANREFRIMGYDGKQKVSSRALGR
jgi:hypothetical protein